ncbi:MFS transporter [Dickeya poaceiphila]|uniref:MFS transporter n=1 Tax=Dickeya poaceiphila TaxID=568768 RepID=A0A5B8HSX7_9GAMM|nr:hypothetical protein [Dickeya poaceiphila]QDX31416.1 MFS transporter [Dickeya poaceiphila]
MIKSFRQLTLCFFILFSTLGFCLYLGFFSFYLVKIKTHPLIISVLIGSTALSSLFWGPLAGRIIDQTRHRFFWLITAQACCVFLVFTFGNQTHFRPVVTPVLVISFSLTVNFAAIIVNQYLLPELHKNYETSVAVASYISGMAVFVTGLLLAALYDSYPPSLFFSVAAGCFLLSALTLVPLLSGKACAGPDEAIHETEKKDIAGIYHQTFRCLKRNWFLALAMCVMAFTETSFNTNFDVIAFSLGTTPFAAVFILGAISGILDSLASWFYPRSVGKTTVNFRWRFFLSTFLLIFSVAALLTFCGYDKKPWFLPSLALCLELTGVWWSIFIAGQVRAASPQGEYGQTMAAFRVPRSVVTFFGMTTIGTALQSGDIVWILSADTALLFLLLALNVYLYMKKNAERCNMENSAAPLD